MEMLTQMANELGQAIKESKEYLAFEDSKVKYDTDEELQKLIGEFNLKKMSVMNEMQKEEAEKDEEKLTEYQDEMRAVYAQILKNEVYTEYNETKIALEELVNKIYGIINFHVTGKEPGCSSSGCASCSGCH